MAAIRKHGQKYRIEYRQHGKRRNVTIPSELPIEFHSVILEHLEHILNFNHSDETKPEVSQVHQRIRTLYQIHKQSDRPSCTLSEIVPEWLGQLRLRKSTINGYAKNTRQLVAFMGATKLRAISESPTHAQSYVDWRVCLGVGKQTIIRELTSLNLILGFAGLSNVVRKSLKLPVETSIHQFSSLRNGKNGRKILLTDQEIQELIETVSENGSQLIADAVVFITYTAARRSEVSRLKPSDIDLDRKTVTLTSHKKKQGIDSPTIVPIHEKLLPVLERRIEFDPVFTDNPDKLSKGFKKAVEGTKFDVPGFCYHALRHAMASRLIQRNVPITAVSRILGHSRVSTTLDIYSHALMDDVRSAIELI